MDPTIGRVAFTMGFLVFALSLLLLPALDPASPQFVVNALALSISGVFLLVIVILVRRAARLPGIRRFDEDAEEPDAGEEDGPSSPPPPDG